jgi:hypothetical protein
VHQNARYVKWTENWRVTKTYRKTAQGLRRRREEAYIKTYLNGHTSFWDTSSSSQRCSLCSTYSTYTVQGTKPTSIVKNIQYWCLEKQVALLVKFVRNLSIHCGETKAPSNCSTLYSHMETKSTSKHSPSCKYFARYRAINRFVTKIWRWF